MRRLLLSLTGSTAAVTGLIALKLAVAGTTAAAGGAGAVAAVTTTAPDGSRTAVGTAVSTPFGVVQVRVTMSGSRLTDVTAISLPDRDRRSRRISQDVGPMLREAALAAQSADIGLISRATYTSDAYARSLESALAALK